MGNRLSIGYRKEKKKNKFPFEYNKLDGGSGKSIELFQTMLDYLQLLKLIRLIDADLVVVAVIDGVRLSEHDRIVRQGMTFSQTDSSSNWVTC